jgi:N-acetylglucosaminyl-diphospho-decaprenol L-rhamnosyltransferase
MNKHSTQNEIPIMSKKMLSIIIVNWNTEEFLAKCLLSIKNYPPSCKYEIWVVDNASTDKSCDFVRNEFPEISLIENKENLGFARANNQVVPLITGRYVLLLNPDTIVKPFALDRLMTFLDTHPETGAVGARLLNPDGTLQESCYPFPTLLREIWRLFHLDHFLAYGIYDMSKWDRKVPRKVDVIKGACLMVHQEIVNTIGLFDNDYFMYSEEVDFCYRLKKAGWLLNWVPEAEVIHFEGQSTQQASEKMFLQLYKGKLLFFQKHHGWLATQIYRIILIIATLCRLLISPFAWFETPKRRQKHLEQTTNYFNLLKKLFSKSYLTDKKGSTE